VYIKDQLADLTGLMDARVNDHIRRDRSANQSDFRGDLSGLNHRVKEPHQYFSNCFNAYARGVNIAVERTGALFERPFKRIPVDNTSYLMRLVIYIHQNPQKHHFTEDFRAWNYSSYHQLTSDVSTRLQRDRLLQLFGSKEDFVRIHQEIQSLEELDEED
jgi:hypothetical protein